MCRILIKYKRAIAGGLHQDGFYLKTQRYFSHDEKNNNSTVLESKVSKSNDVCNKKY